MNRILGEPALGRHIRGYYAGVVKADVLERLVEIRTKLARCRTINTCVAELEDELVGYIE